jgi:surface antigen
VLGVVPLHRSCTSGQRRHHEGFQPDFAVTSSPAAVHGREEDGVRAAHWTQRVLLAAFILAIAGGWSARPAYAYNCVNVVLRDAYWGQFRGVVQSGGLAAGIGSAFARSGFSVDGVPDVGTVMVWPPGAYGASSAGHVGLVAAVNGNGTVLVRHENWPYGMGERMQTMTVQSGHRFVHRIAAAVANVVDSASGSDYPESPPPSAPATQ